MLIGGWQKFSLNEYPGKTSAILFTQGCNFRCRYCHNPDLVLKPQFTQLIAIDEIFAFLQSRQGKLDAVSITGGEPTLQQDLIPFIRKIKKMKFLIKLDSNGTNPDMLAKIIKLNCVDYLAMDIKAPLEKYQKITSTVVDSAQLQKSINLIINSGIEHEFRTTIVKSLTSQADLITISQTIQGAQHYYLQRFIASKLIDPSLQNETSYSLAELEKLAIKLSAFVQHCEVR